MKKDDFLRLLHDELIRHGATAEVADHHVRVIAQTFTPEDIARVEHIENPDEVSRLAQAIVMIKAKPAEKSAPAGEPRETVSAEAVPSPESPEVQSDIPQDDDSDMKVYTGEPVVAPSPRRTSAVADEDAFYEDMIRDDEEDGFVHAVTPRGKQTFWIIFACSLPLILVFLVLYFSLFAAMFTALCSLIILLVAGLIGGVAIGAAISFICIAYGITQLITVASAAPGLYEIGLGISVAGIVMLGGILVYNMAIRLVPLLMRLLGSLFHFCTGKLKNLFRRAKEACYTL